MAQISPIYYVKELEKVINPDNQFYSKGRVDAGADKFDTITIPTQTKRTAAKQGTPSLPLQINYVEDGVRTYSVGKIYNQPEMVTFEDSTVLNYNKLTSIAQLQGELLMTQMANKAAYSWSPTETKNIFLTTGSARATTLVGATGNRKAVAKADILKIGKRFAEFNVPFTQIIGLLTPDMYYDMLAIDEFVNYEKLGVVSKLQQGIVGNLLGIEFYRRLDPDYFSIGVHYSANGATKKESSTTAVATTDSPSSLFFSPMHVRYAQGSAQTQINYAPAGYLGATIIESWVRFGAAYGRGDQVGVVALVEGT